MAKYSSLPAPLICEGIALEAAKSKCLFAKAVVVVRERDGERKLQRNVRRERGEGRDSQVRQRREGRVV
jgi:hypothetical protein